MKFPNNWQINIRRFRLPSPQVPVPGQPIWCPSATMLRTRFGRAPLGGGLSRGLRCRNSGPLDVPARENLPLITLLRCRIRFDQPLADSPGRPVPHARSRVRLAFGPVDSWVIRRRLGPADRGRVFAPHSAGMANVTFGALNQRARGGVGGECRKLSKPNG